MCLVAAVSLRRQHLSALAPELLHSARIAAKSSATLGRVITASSLMPSMRKTPGRALVKPVRLMILGASAFSKLATTALKGDRFSAERKRLSAQVISSFPVASCALRAIGTS